jgi:hypothetical protein
MLEIMRDESYSPKIRFEAAKAALPSSAEGRNF